MKKITLGCLFCVLTFGAYCQTADNKWNVGLHGGATQYNGDLGNSFYTFDQAFYGHVGLSVSRYLTRHLDVAVFLTRGELGYQQDRNLSPDIVGRGFRIRPSTANLLLRYHFFSPETFIRPYVFAGAGVLQQTGLSDGHTNQSGYDFSIPSVGAGLNFRLGPYFNIQLQELFMYTSEDDMDLVTGGINDMYLFHSLGITFNIPKFSGAKSGPEGVGDRIDQCSDPSRHSKKAKADMPLKKKKEKSPRKKVKA